MTATFIACTLLLFFRLLPLFVVSPIMVFRRLPVTVRVVFSIAIAAVLASATALDRPIHLSWLMLASEFILGLSFAFGFHSALGAIGAMGHVIDQQMALAAAAVFDPGTEQTASLVSETLTFAALIGFLILDGHHAVLRGLSVMTDLIPLGTAISLSPQFLQVLGVQFALAFALVAPVMIGMWLADFALALMSRAAPQANIYFVAAPVKLGLGLLALAWLTSSVLPVLGKMFSTAIDTWPTTVGA